LPDQSGALLIIRPAELAPGFYRGELEIRSNGANSPNLVEVALEVLAPAEPWLRPLSFSDRITSGEVEEISPGMLLALHGEQLTLGEAGQAEGPPWPVQLAGARLLVNGVPAALERVTATEIRFQAPSELEPGEAVLEIERDGTKGNSIAVAVLSATPRVESVTFEDGTPVSAEKPVRAGDRLLITATGLGRCEPAVPGGTVAPEGARTVEAVTVSFLSSPFAPRTVAEAQAAPSTAQPGRYLVRVTVPEGISPSNSAALNVLAGGVSSNSVPIVVR
jgi:uncharacterized protein (TIGR03437 family)